MPTGEQEQMKPTNANEQVIAEKVDRKARAIRDGVGAWDNQIMGEMRVSTPFEMTPFPGRDDIPIIS
jgi:hypothetical protein